MFFSTQTRATHMWLDKPRREGIPIEVLSPPLETHHTSRPLPTSPTSEVMSTQHG